jgi:hypothetical protein
MHPRHSSRDEVQNARNARPFCLCQLGAPEPVRGRRAALDTIWIEPERLIERDRLPTIADLSFATNFTAICHDTALSVLPAFFATRLAISGRLSDVSAVDRGFDVAGLAIICIAREFGARYDRIPVSRQDGHTVPGFLPRQAAP